MRDEDHGEWVAIIQWLRLIAHRRGPKRGFRPLVRDLLVCEREHSISSDSSRDTADTHIRTTAGMSRIRMRGTRSTHADTHADAPCD
jgi:hypothetical protein